MEHLYRGKMVGQCIWLKGSLHYSKLKKEHSITDQYSTNENLQGYTHEVESETVTKYIGLKDKLGNKIFEGDFYREEYVTTETGANNTIYCICTWIQEICCYGWLSEGNYTAYIDNGIDILDDNGVPFNCTDFDCKGLQIIGNIFDNANKLNIKL